MKKEETKQMIDKICESRKWNGDKKQIFIILVDALNGVSVNTVKNMTFELRELFSNIPISPDRE